MAQDNTARVLDPAHVHGLELRAGRQTLRERRERGERPTDGPAEAASMRNMARLRCTPSLLDPACVHGLGLRAVER